jgi:hypothetical protein
MVLRGTVVALVVEDANAKYPVTVDPLVWTQQAELTAADGMAGANFGYSVAIDGDTAIVGAPGAGAAYVFVQTGTTWTQQAVLSASGGSFGAAVAVNGDTAIIGAPSTALDDGAAYIFARSGETWTQQAELTPLPVGWVGSGEAFGSAVAIEGSTAIVGAPSGGASGQPSAGFAFIFVQNGGTWTQQAQLTPSDGVWSDAFGGSVALSGSTVVIGAPYHPFEQGSPTAAPGAAYIFLRSGTTWTQQGELHGMAGDVFGTSVALSGSTAVIGAGDGNAHTGAVYVFAQSDTTWTQQAELTAIDGAAGDWFGGSVALSNGTAAIAASEHQVGSNGARGAVYVFSQSGATWVQQAELAASDGVPHDFFADCGAPCQGIVGVTGSTVIVGAYWHPVGTSAGQGAAYIFTAPGANGTACTADSDCTSTFCVDGVCCDTACGGGVATDCQSCLGAMTGGADGTCGTVAATANYTCRPSTGPCDPAGVCDGSSPSCPAAAAPDGGCASSSSSTSSASSSSGAGSFHLTGGCDCRAVPDRGDGRDATRAAWLGLGLGLAIGRRRRCRAVRT